jgi:hypothetical protein
MMFSIGLMEKNKRRERFRAYFAGPPFKGDRAAFMRATSLSKGRVAQLFDDKQPFGEKAAAALAEKLNLPADYFEQPAAVGSTEGMQSPQIHDALASLTRDQFLRACANLSTPDWQLTVRLWVAVGIVPGAVEVVPRWDLKEAGSGRATVRPMTLDETAADEKARKGAL